MNAPNKTCKTCGAWWRLPLLLMIVLAGVWLLRGPGVREVAPRSDDARQATQAEATDGQSVSLTIDFGGGRRSEFEPIAWRPGMTVEDATRETPRKYIRLNVIGSAESAFLASLDGTENEGADGRNWTYSVNGKNGDRSFAVFELKPGDQVLWTFGKQQ